MKKLIIYGSEYGTTKAYASKLSEMTNIPMVDYKDIAALSEYDVIIHFGGLYAGGVKGLKKTIQNMRDTTKLLIVTVGLADPKDTKNTESIQKSIQRQVPEKIYNTAQVFHLRGGIDYSKLSFTHKAMMTLLYNKAKRLPEEKKTAEIRAMIETFNKQVDFTDFDALLPILSSL